MVQGRGVFSRSRAARVAVGGRRAKCRSHRLRCGRSCAGYCDNRTATVLVSPALQVTVVALRPLSEMSITLCVPGEEETLDMLKLLMTEAGKEFEA